MEDAMKAWNRILVEYHLEDTCYGECWAEVCNRVKPFLQGLAAC